MYAAFMIFGIVAAAITLTLIIYGILFIVDYREWHLLFIGLGVGVIAFVLIFFGSKAPDKTYEVTNIKTGEIYQIEYSYWEGIPYKDVLYREQIMIREETND